MLFWEEKARGKGKERDLLLFEKGIVNTKRKEGGRKFIFKNMLKVGTSSLSFIHSFKTALNCSAQLLLSAKLIIREDIKDLKNTFNFKVYSI